MIGYVGHLETDTEVNDDFRHVIFTAKNTQLVLMKLMPGEEIGMEVHPTIDQFFRIESGDGKVVMNGEEATFAAGDGIIVPAGTQHNVIANSPVKLYTLYSPPNHPADRVQHTKAEAMAAE